MRNRRICFDKPCLENWILLLYFFRMMHLQGRLWSVSDETLRARSGLCRTLKAVLRGSVKPFSRIITDTFVSFRLSHSELSWTVSVVKGLKVQRVDWRVCHWRVEWSSFCVVATTLSIPIFSFSLKSWPLISSRQTPISSLTSPLSPESCSFLTDSFSAYYNSAELKNRVAIL